MILVNRARGGPRRKSERERGQGLVEFALVFPIFWGVLMALIEFTFGFNAVLSVGFASRNAALIAAEASNSSTADCSILRSIEGDIDAPASVNQISKVDIYWTNANGAIQSGAITTYTRSVSASLACTVNGSSFTVPYSQTANGYPYSARCTTRAGCGSGHTGLDTIGVKISYFYRFVTPYGAVLGNSGWSLDRSSEMRLEPYQ